MSKRTVLSERLLKSKAAYVGLSLVAVNEMAGLGPNYIYRLAGRENVQLATINRIATVLGCAACDLLEEVDVADQAASGAR